MCKCDKCGAQTCRFCGRGDCEEGRRECLEAKVERLEKQVKALEARPAITINPAPGIPWRPYYPHWNERYSWISRVDDTGTILYGANVNAAGNMLESKWQSIGGLIEK